VPLCPRWVSQDSIKNSAVLPAMLTASAASAGDVKCRVDGSTRRALEQRDERLKLLGEVSPALAVRLELALNEAPVLVHVAARRHEYSSREAITGSSRARWRSG